MQALLDMPNRRADTINQSGKVTLRRTKPELTSRRAMMTAAMPSMIQMARSIMGPREVSGGRPPAAPRLDAMERWSQRRGWSCR